MESLPLDVYPIILSNLGVTFDFKHLNLTNKYFNNLISTHPQFLSYRELVGAAVTKLDNNHMTNLIEHLYAYVKAPNKHKRKVKTPLPPRGIDTFGIRSCYFSKSDEATRELKISWWEFLFLVGCEEGSDLSLDLIANYSIIKKHLQNIHLGFATACYRGSFSIVKSLYDVGTSLGVDLYLNHFCDNNGMFCIMQECDCHNDIYSAPTLISKCFRNKSTDILQWCIDTSQKNKYPLILNKFIPAVFSMKLHDTITFGLNRTFIQQCLAGHHKMAEMIYQHNVSNQFQIGHFAPALLLKSCHGIISCQKIKFKNKVSTIELLLKIFVTHFGEVVESDDDDLDIMVIEEEAEDGENLVLSVPNEPLMDSQSISYYFDKLFVAEYSVLHFYSTYLNFFIKIARSDIKLSRATMVKIFNFSVDNLLDPRIVRNKSPELTDPDMAFHVSSLFNIWTNDKYFDSTTKDNRVLNLANHAISFHCKKKIEMVPKLLERLTSTDYYVLQFDANSAKHFAKRLDSLCKDGRTKIITKLLEFSVKYQFYDWITTEIFHKIMQVLMDTTYYGIAKTLLQFRDKVIVEHPKIICDIDFQKLFTECCNDRNLDMVKWLCYNYPSKINIHASDEHAFCMACANKYIDVAKFLLEFSLTPPNTPIQIDGGDNAALYNICQYGNVEFAKWLYEISGTRGLNKIIIGSNKEVLIWSCEKFGYDELKDWLETID